MRVSTSLFFAMFLSLASMSEGAPPAGRTPNGYGYNHDLSIRGESVNSPQPRYAITASDAKRAVRGGLAWVRYWLYWNRVNPEPGVFDWSQPDAEFQKIIDARGVIYVNLDWGPPHASEGKKTYLPFECMKLDGSNDFDHSKEYCENPPMIDSEKLRLVVREFLWSHADLIRAKKIRAFGCWNEPGYPIFWPPGSVWDLVEHVLRPCAEEVQEFRRIQKIAPNDLLIVGPEEFDPKNLNRILTIEKDLGIRLFDVISIHLYYGLPGTTYPEGPLALYDNRFRPTIERFGENRPVWVTETGIHATNGSVEAEVERGVKLVQMLAGLEARKTIRTRTNGRLIVLRGVERVFLYKLRSASCDWDEHSILNCDGTPKPAWFAIRTFVTGK